ncbi:transposase [Bradyrhizobium sp. CW11]|nr:transposase [Bradyrhizobium sp. CW11]
MQVNVLGAERRRRWSYDEKVRLVEETLQPGETVCEMASRHGVTHSLPFTWPQQARQGDWAEMLRLLLFPSRSHLHGHRHDQHVATGVFPSCATRKDGNHRDRAQRRLSCSR